MVVKAPQWRKSSKSAVNNCVEVAWHKGSVLIRDTKRSFYGEVLSVTPEDWSVFVDGVRAGEFDAPWDWK